MTVEHLDVLVIGAGLSGVDAAYHLQTRCPTRSYAILEGRAVMGGTWDLFRYPGIRSDSDMHTLGYPFRPWTGPTAIVDGATIRQYIADTAAAYGIDRKIRYQHRMTRAEWSSNDARWTIDVEVGPERTPSRLTCSFLFMCTGYYDYERGHAPAWPDMERFRGQVVHPQHWPEQLDYAGKRVVVIGSGATAVTLVPAMAKEAAHVTMLQRSPSYVVVRPSRDVVADALRRVLPLRVAHGLTRWKNVLLNQFFYTIGRRRPERMKRMMRHGVRQELGPDYDIDTHFTPRYNPWDQRVCVVPDSDLFATIRAGCASVVTDHIERFTETGLELRSGAQLDADVVVTATGLTLKLMDGVTLAVDGATVDLSKTTAYKGMMYSGVPNLASAVGYTNASWTLKCDLISEYVCRLLNVMQQSGYVSCTPRLPEGAGDDAPLLDLASGYVQRAASTLPRQRSVNPWRANQNYMADVMLLRHGRVEDGVMEFRRGAVRGAGASPPPTFARGTPRRRPSPGTRSLP